MTPFIAPGLHAPLKAYLTLLEKWNRIHALTALPPEARWEELVLDSAALLPHLLALPPGSRIGDFGTGMGMPAVLLALARPDLKVLALDKSKKKLAFVRQVALVLELKNLETVHGRFEDLPPLCLSTGVAKALGSLAFISGWWELHGAPGAPFLALKAQQDAPEAAPTGWQVEATPYQLPSRGERRVLLMKKGG